MPEFLELMPVQQALDLFLDHLPVKVGEELLPVEDSLDRVARRDVYAPHSLPEFRRSTVDGYAVRAADTHGASDSLPAYLHCISEVPMGGAPNFKIDANECAIIHTGGMIPEGADAVIMVEETQDMGRGEIELFKSVGVGENIIEKGEDVSEGELVISGGTVLRPAEIGGLMALGITEIQVSQKLRVGIISSGDEVVPPWEDPRPGEVRDVNSYTLGSLVDKTGGLPVHYGIIADNRQALQDALRKAREECSLVIVTAGSSASSRDLTSRVMDGLGKPGVLVHGVNVKPGKPTILAVAENTALIGLPGNPVSALVIANLFVVPVIQQYLGVRRQRPQPAVQAELQINISSSSGREDWVPVKLARKKNGGYQAVPVFGKSNLIFILSQADGLFQIPAEANGINAGQTVTVRLI